VFAPNLYFQRLVLNQEPPQSFPRNSKEHRHLNIADDLSSVGIKMWKGLDLFPVVVRVNCHLGQSFGKVVRQDVSQILFTPVEEHSCGVSPLATCFEARCPASRLTPIASLVQEVLFRVTLK